MKYLPNSIFIFSWRFEKQRQEVRIVVREFAWFYLVLYCFKWREGVTNLEKSWMSFMKWTTGQGVVRPRQAALQGRLHLGRSRVQTGGTETAVDSVDFVQKLISNFKYSPDSRFVKFTVFSHIQSKSIEKRIHDNRYAEFARRRRSWNAVAARSRSASRSDQKLRQ